MVGPMNVIDIIASDLTAFADPKTEVLVDNSNAVWVQDGRERAVKFSRPPSGAAFPTVSVGNKALTYEQFLAGPAMADLARFAGFVARVTPRTDVYVETSAAITGADEGQLVGDARDIVLTLSTEDLPFLSTRVILVQGEAGAGKTIALRELTIRQAEAYQQGGADRLFFYVNAQGRALSRIEDAIAKDLDDLRAAFPYAAVTPLTRHGLLVPIIDGFDELLGSGGYDEAFSSLAALISTLDGQGAVVASARSAFFDYRSFRENAQKFAQGGKLNYELETVRVLPWQEAEQEEYVGAVAGEIGRDVDVTVGQFREAATQLSEPDRALLSKPFYVNKVVELLLGGDDIPAGGHLLDVLVDSFLSREYEKLKAKEDVPLLSVKGHKQFLHQLADEMWWLESRRVDLETLQILIEMVAEDFGLPPESAKALVARVSSYPFLTTQGTEKGWYRFEHEVLYGYFLSHRLRECIEGDRADLRRFLNRAVADDSLVSQTARLIGPDSKRIARATEAISYSLRGGLTDVVGRENGGRLVAALIASTEELVEDLVMIRLIFKQVGFGRTKLSRPVFEGCELDSVDLSEAVMTDPLFKNCTIRVPTVDPATTRLERVDEGILDQLNGVEIVSPVDGVDQLGRIFAPDQLRRILRAMGGSLEVDTASEKYSPDVQERVDVADRFLRKMERRFYASDNDIQRFPFASGHAWEKVWEQLEGNGLIESVVIAKRGRNEPMRRLSVPPDIVRKGEDPSAAVPANVKMFWQGILN